MRARRRHEAGVLEGEVALPLWASLYLHGLDKHFMATVVSASGPTRAGGVVGESDRAPRQPRKRPRAEGNARRWKDTSTESTHQDISDEKQHRKISRLRLPADDDILAANQRTWVVDRRMGRRATRPVSFRRDAASIVRR